MLPAWIRHPVCRWLLLTMVCAAVIWHLHPRTDLRCLMPEGDSPLARSARFFESQGGVQILAVEAATDGPIEAAVTILEDLGQRAAHLGARPLATAEAGTVGRLLGLLHQNLPLLVDEAQWPRLEEQLKPAALRDRMKAMVEHLKRGEAGLETVWLYRDPLLVGRGVLEGLREVQTGIDPEHGVAVHPGRHHAVLVLRIDFPPYDINRTAALIEFLDQERQPALAKGVRLEPVGSYRHFHENQQQIASVFTVQPLGLLVILILLWSILRRWRAVAASFTPPLLALAGGVAGVVVYFGGGLPLMLLGFGVCIIGIADDYGTHMTRSLQAGQAAAVRRPLTLGFLSTAAVFACLLVSAVPIVRGIGLFVVVGLALAWFAALDLLPVLVGRGPVEPDRWRFLSHPLSRFLGLASRPAWRRGIVAVLLLASLLALPGLLRLRFNDDLMAFDGSSPETRKALAGFLDRWGNLGGSNFLVAEGPTLEAALTRIEACRTVVAGRASVLELVLPSQARQEARLKTWNRFWEEHRSSFATDLAAVCAELRLRVAAFAPALERYAPVEGQAWITPATWKGTPLAESLDALIRPLPQGGMVAAAPVVDDQVSEVDRIARILDGRPQTGAWLASRRHLAQHLVAGVKSELFRVGGCVLGVLLLLLLVSVRRLRPVIAAYLPALLALAWTFGLLGWCGVRLLPFHALVAAFVGGIGIDQAFFLSEPAHRRQSLTPILATTLTTIVGVGSVALSTHPLLVATGTALVLGMALCLLASLLVVPVLLPDEDPSSHLP